MKNTQTKPNKQTNKNSLNWPYIHALSATRLLPWKLETQFPDIWWTHKSFGSWNSGSLAAKFKVLVSHDKHLIVRKCGYVSTDCLCLWFCFCSHYFVSEFYDCLALLLHGFAPLQLAHCLVLVVCHPLTLTHALSATVCYTWLQELTNQKPITILTLFCLHSLTLRGYYLINGWTPLLWCSREIKYSWDKVKKFVQWALLDVWAQRVFWTFLGGDMLS